MAAERIPNNAQLFALGLIASGEYRYNVNARNARHRAHLPGRVSIRRTTLDVLFDQEWITFKPGTPDVLICTEKGEAWRTRRVATGQT